MAEFLFILFGFSRFASVDFTCLVKSKPVKLDVYIFHLSGLTYGKKLLDMCFFQRTLKS